MYILLNGSHNKPTRREPVEDHYGARKAVGRTVPRLEEAKLSKQLADKWTKWDYFALFIVGGMLAGLIAMVIIGNWRT